LSEQEHKQLLVELMSSEAITTSNIEGEVLNRDSVQFSIQRQLGLAATSAGPPAEQGIAEMMLDLYRSFREPLSQKNSISLAHDGQRRPKRPRRHWPLPHKQRADAHRLRQDRRFESSL
jgi:hypothetical protein